MQLRFGLLCPVLTAYLSNCFCEWCNQPRACPTSPPTHTQHPGRYIDSLVKAGAAGITVHWCVPGAGLLVGGGGGLELGVEGQLVREYRSARLGF